MGKKPIKKLLKNRHRYSLRERLDFSVKNEESLRWSINDKLKKAFLDPVKRVEYMLNLINGLDKLIEEENGR